MLQNNIDNTKAIDKINKLLALGTSPNENEAKLATERANKLLLKYNLTMDQIQKKETIQSSMDLGKTRLSSWESILMKSICELNMCEVLTSRGRTVAFIVIGKDINVITSKNMFEYLTDAVIALAKKNAGKGVAAKNSYKIGVVYGLIERLDALKESNMTEDFEGTTAVAIYDLYSLTKKKNEAYMNDNFKVKKSRTNVNVSNFGEFQNGKRDSKNINFNKQVK